MADGTKKPQTQKTMIARSKFWEQCYESCTMYCTMCNCFTKTLFTAK